ncbi:MAG: Protein translocase subunit SecF [Candidatus Nomurabacteria bacterium GW2011_GWE1_32_28]|uniref:Protein-export membrane protein SecF n=1 Tax=Candidatus Nomurabacteria bacterium GW2011_GWF1_31_48 TaxID=1618767 RepID=A0A0F9YDU6_9BACT|nr:MAG: Protein translocase subunit SecF [Candidatus Nomurabacteria bacterium GW2011_GWF2_30_133]KKP28249.1 MAG: Protein translocase subunit SecF [Candidatus Nomurabacteria bacterium GW2011_GWE2_31_40]KKP29844.1 MAG: Protein translocase subunit SecF [Candidatus Nomurabacteria bacterium GW2011_GWF1_31_48]KKP34585.1 MAG: Protein translocase subunit SecF [Candidatus Nomurabacteria bacterium GW2011_GWE1_32_28]HAS80431.1 protein translocase subunit SecF [Candidatus Nomurabacteria bacterium]
MFIVKYKKIFLSISVILVLSSLVSLFVFGFQIGIDFKGGALTEVVYQNNRPLQSDLDNAFKTLDLGSVLIQPTGELGYIVKSIDLNEAQHSLLLKTLSEDGKSPLEEKDFNSIGPSVGRELTRKAIIAIILVSIAIILFIAFAFRKVSKPVSSWKYGLMAIVSLLHDVIIPIGLFTYLSHFYGAEVDTLFVVAILTILGLSVSDTIVIFDRIRENLKDKIETNFSDTVGRSLDQSYMRSVFTSVTVIIVLLSLFFFGPESTKYFALMLTAGMFFGTYSSIFLASPLLVLIEELQSKNK